ncbi:hypothetical protein D3C78_918840 [compost metagenome]
MTLKSRQYIGRFYAEAIIDDADEGKPALLDRNVDRCASGVNRVLDQLLHNGSRTLHDLSRRNLVSQLLFQHFDFSHGAAAPFSVLAVQLSLHIIKPLHGLHRR